MEKRIGIIGGMGPIATVELFRMIVENPKSNVDQDHIQIFIDNNTKIPDRTKAILEGGTSPVPAILDSAERLEKAGADFLLMPCNTSHYYLDEIQKHCSVPVLNMIKETAAFLDERKIRRVGLLATTGTIRGNVFERYFHPYGIELIYPDEEHQKAVMDFIYSGVKAGDTNYDCSRFLTTVHALMDAGAETIVLGCTELPVGKQMYSLDFPSVDAMEILARTAIVKAGYQLVQGRADE